MFIREIKKRYLELAHTFLLVSLTPKPFVGEADDALTASLEK